MKIFHLSDLHIGKQLKAYDLADVQRDVLNQVVEQAKSVRPDAIVIAGDIYDKSAPSGEAFRIFDEFLTSLAGIVPAIPVLIISGNHDSNLRLNYAASFLAEHHIYIAASLPAADGEHIQKVVLRDAYGAVNFYLLPFVRPADAKNLLKNIRSGEAGDREIRTYDDAVGMLLSREEVDFSERNVLVAHQFFVSGDKAPERRDSELQYLSVGGIDSVRTKWVEGFDYVALGHLHSGQPAGASHIRYCGSPLKYSLSEEKDKKSIVMVTLNGKGSGPELSWIPLSMRPDVRSVKGTFREVWEMAGKEVCPDYVSITLTDEKEEAIRDSKARLGERYARILDVTVENSRTKAILEHDWEEESAEPLALFAAFYQEMHGQPMSEEEGQVMEEIMNAAAEKRSQGV